MTDFILKRLIPASLNPGDTIGVVAPASPFDSEKLRGGVETLKKMGYKILIPKELEDYKLLSENEVYLAGPDQLRAKLINSFFDNPNVKAIMCARGGFGSIKMLSFLDYELIKNNPKIFIGFSDITVLLSVLFSKCGLMTFHGPMVTTIKPSDSVTKEMMTFAFTSNKSIKIFPENGVTIKTGKASGIVMGGNLASLCHLVGTPFEPNFEGCILVVEDIEEPYYKIDRMMTQMKLSGCLKNIAGVAIGSFKKCGDYNIVCKIIKDIFKDNVIPILSGFGIGHGARNITIPIGLSAKLDADAQYLQFHEPATR